MATDDRAAAIKKFDATGKVAIDTVGRSILPLLSKPDSSNTDWGTLLSKYTTAARQIESLWQDMDPVFSLSIPVPKKPTPPESIPISSMLNASIPPEDKGVVITPDKEHWRVTESELAIIRQHNHDMETVLNVFNVRVEERRVKRERASTAAVDTKKAKAS